MHILGLIQAGFHVVARILLLYKLLREKTCRGVSLKTQELLLLMYVARYIDILWRFDGIEAEVIKIVHIILAGAIVGLMRFSPKVVETYDADCDVVPRAFMIVPPVLLALVFHKMLLVVELSHAFSWYLEAIVLIPQFVLLWRRQKYARWVLGLVILLGTEGLLDGMPYVLSWHASQSQHPYDLLAAVMQVTVYAGGLAMLVLRYIEVGKPAANDEAELIALEPGKVYEASAFEFSEEKRPGGLV
ncbi:hypothetical protein FOA52_014257 [Chlamydomonas sp. UWO 241]|nr:hypothetical protein FOA52_014257 [Chlamydomonas sp. UWO 241]